MLQRYGVSVVLVACVVGGMAASAAQGATNPANKACKARTLPAAALATRAFDGVALAATSATGAIIANGTVQLGVLPEGHLNAPAPGFDPLGIGFIGLRYIPTGAASTEPGCLCEGWGVAALDPSSASGAIVGYANEAEGIENLTVESFVATASSATSTVLVGDPATLRVTHAYRPSSATANLYEVLVRIENLTDEPARIRYRRVMDWDVYPTPFDEFVTMQKGTSPQLVATTNDGFDTPDPTSGPSNLGFTGSFVDAGPDDHGANFTFDFGVLEPDDVLEFATYYGAAGSEADALTAIGAVGVEAYSLGQPNTPTGPTLGEPNTFIFAFGGIGGSPVQPPALTKVVPDAGGSCGSATVVGHGSRFKPGAVFSLTRPGQADIEATSVTVAPDGFSIQGTFDFRGAALGVWNARVVNPDDGSPDTEESAVLADAFTVEDCRVACIDVDVVGPLRVAANRRAVFSAAITNLGNIDAVGATVSITGLPADVVTEILDVELPATLVPGGIDVAVPVLPPNVTRYFEFAVTAPPPLSRSFGITAGGLPSCSGFRQLPVAIVGSIDPNEKVGPTGVGDAGYLTGSAPLTFMISFENSSEASAPAQEVIVTDQLDPTKVDLGSISLGPITFAGTTVAILPGQSEFVHPGVPFDVVADLNENGNLLDDDILVRIEARLVSDPEDPSYGRVVWTLRSLDPATGELPVDPFRGFLAPGGQGSVVFTLQALPELVTGDEITDQASIVFDLNDAILPPPWLNTIDKTAPQSQVHALPATVVSPFLVEWSGADGDSGVAGFDVYVSVDGGAPTALVTDTTATSTLFNGEPGRVYAFFSRARDRVGNEEALAAEPDATTAVVEPTTTSTSSTSSSSTSSTSSSSTSTSIASTSTTSTSSTSSSTSTSSTSSTASSTSSTSTTPTSSTTTTTLACSTARCIIEAALASGACADDRIPPGIRRNLSRAVEYIEEAERMPLRASMLRRPATRALTLAHSAAKRATKGSRPRLSDDCAEVLSAAALAVRDTL